MASVLLVLGRLDDGRPVNDALRLVRALRDRHRFALVAPAGPLQAAFQREGVAHHAFPAGGFWQRGLGFRRALGKALREHRAELVHVHGAPELLLLARLAALRRPFVLTLYPPPAAAGPEPPGPAAPHRLAAWAGRLARAVLVADPADAARLREAGLPADRLRVLPRVVEDPLAIPPPAPPWPPGFAAPGGVLVGTAAAPDGAGAGAGLRPILDAFALITAQHPRVRLVILDGGGDEGELRAWIRQRGLENRIWLPERPVPVVPLLRYLDVFCSPAGEERAWVRCVEAMASFVPVVAPRTEALAAVVEEEETGLLVAPGGIRSLAASLERLLHQPELRRRLGRAGRERYEREFSLRRLADEVDAVYRSLLPAVDKPPVPAGAPAAHPAGAPAAAPERAAQAAPSSPGRSHRRRRRHRARR